MGERSFPTCECGRLDLAQLMILQGGEAPHNPPIRLTREGGMGERSSPTCAGGHLPLAQFIIQMGADDFDQGLCQACLGGHLPLAQLMIQHGATHCVCGKPLILHLEGSLEKELNGEKQDSQPKGSDSQTVHAHHIAPRFYYIDRY